MHAAIHVQVLVKSDMIIIIVDNYTYMYYISLVRTFVHICLTSIVKCDDKISNDSFFYRNSWLFPDLVFDF